MPLSVDMILADKRTRKFANYRLHFKIYIYCIYNLIHFIPIDTMKWFLYSKRNTAGGKMRTVLDAVRLFYRKHIANSFLTKNMLIYSIISIFPVLILALLVSSSITSMLLKKQLQQNDLMLYNMNQYVNTKYELTYKIVKQAYSDIVTVPEVFAFLENNIDKPSVQYTDYKKKFDSYFFLFFGADKDLENVLVYKKINQTTYLISRNTNRALDNSEVSPDFLTKINIKAPTVTISAAHVPKYRPDSMVYSFSINIKVLGTNENSGLLMLDFDPNGFGNALKQMGYSQPQGSIYVLTPSGDILFDSTGSLYGQKFPYLNQVNAKDGSIMINGERVILSASIDNEPGLTIVNMVPQKIVLRDVNVTKQLIFGVSFLCILLAAVFIPVSTVYFSRRIKLITSAMSAVRDGKLATRVSPMKQHDEIGIIAESLNRMCDDLQQYINKVYVAEIKQKNAEINALQAQINPHFLYNTLEAIHMTAIAHGDKEVGKMVYILANLFRSIVREETIVPLASEIEYAKSYLELFKIRYGDKLQYQFDVSENALSLGIVKHLIQPVIENYIMHGYDVKKEKNIIEIQCYLQEDAIIITITDNGFGIKPDHLAQIKRDLATFDAGTQFSIGLRNVNERIRLIYGASYSLDIVSEEGLGTTVLLRVAAKTQKELMENVQRIDRG
jgi:two-component system, sensor histidine kinase YesM